MIRLSRVALREIHLPLVEPFQTAAGLIENRRTLLLELSDADGLAVWSECVAEALPKYAPETIDTYWARDVVVPPWTKDSAGLVRVPLDVPGLGVDIDVGFIDDLTVRRAVFETR
ncbi:MAG: hypothetical protein ABI556_00310 [Gemmatimonadales bacterium]